MLYLPNYYIKILEKIYILHVKKFIKVDGKITREKKSTKNKKKLILSNLSPYLLIFKQYYNYSSFI